jgi:hypothetical protein
LDVGAAGPSLLTPELEEERMDGLAAVARRPPDCAPWSRRELEAAAPRQSAAPGVRVV